MKELSRNKNRIGHNSEKTKRNEFLSIESITEIVENYFGFDPGAIQERTNKREIVTVRQIAHYLCWFYNHAGILNTTLSKIGKQIGNKGHDLVLHSKKTILDLIFAKTRFKNVLIETHIENIKFKINAVYTRKEQKTAMDTGNGFQIPGRAISKNKILSLSGMAQSQESIFARSPIMRGTQKSRGNSSGPNGRSHKANQPCKPIRNPQRPIWGSFTRRKFAKPL